MVQGLGMNDGGNDGLEDWQCLMWPQRFLPTFKLLGDGLDGYLWQVPPRCLISVEDAASPLRCLSASPPRVPLPSASSLVSSTPLSSSRCASSSALSKSTAKCIRWHTTASPLRKRAKRRWHSSRWCYLLCLLLSL